MKQLGAWNALFLIFIILVGLSCSMNGEFLPEGERDSMYTVTLSSGLMAIPPSSRLTAGVELSFSCVEQAGAPPPAIVEVAIENPVYPRKAIALYATSAGMAQAKNAAKAAASGLAPLPFAGGASAFVIPSDLPDDFYDLVVTVSDPSGAALAQKIIPLYVLDRAWLLRGVSIYPAKVEASAFALLSLDAGYPSGADPWIRWIDGDRVVAEGFASEGFLQAVYQAPETLGAYGLRVELYPSRPGARALKKPPLQDAVKILVSKEKGEPDPVFGKAYSIYYRCAGDWFDSGTASSSSLTAPSALPAYRPFDGGFGQLVDETRSVTRSGPAFAPGGTLVALRLFAESADGALVRFSSPGGTAFSLGLKAGVPVVSAERNGESFSYAARSALKNRGAKRATIVLEIFEKDGGIATFKLYLDGLPAGEAALPFQPSAAGFSAMALGGSGSADFILDELAIGPVSLLPAPFEAGLAYRYGKDLAFGRDFSSGEALSEGPWAGDSGLVLAKGQREGLPALALKKRTILAIAGEFGDKPVPVLSFVDGERRVAALRSDGVVLGGDGSALGSTPGSGAFALGLRLEEGRLVFEAVRDSDGELQVKALGSVEFEGDALSLDLMNPVAATVLFRYAYAYAVNDELSATLRAGAISWQPPPAVPR